MGVDLRLVDKGSKLLSENCEHITFLVLMALSEE